MMKADAIFRMRPSAAVAMLAAALAAPLAAAEGTTALSVDDCVERALAASESAAIGAAREVAAEARLDFARRQYLPSLALSGSFTHSSEVDPGSLKIGPQTITLGGSKQDAWLFRLGLQQPIFTGFRIEGGIRQAAAGLVAARSERAVSDKAVASAAEKSWWALYMAGQSAAVAEESAAAQSAHVEEARARLENGAGLKSELLSAQMRAADIDAMVAEARAARDQARARLNVMLGLPWDAPTGILAPGEPDLDRAAPDVAVLARKARAARPELAAAAARKAAQEAALEAARSALMPSVFLTGSYSVADPNPKVFPQRSGLESYWDVGVLVSMDLGRVPATLAQADEARSALEQSRLSLAQLGDSVELEVATACLDLAKCAQRLRAGSSSVGLAEEALRSQKDRYAAGLAVASAVSDSENDLLRARLDRTRSRVSWELARIALRDAVGE
jgi:outer membrane protein